jgi:CRP/FNR family transcriptional regulator, cyclic AMP receptor protein
MNARTKAAPPAPRTLAKTSASLLARISVGKSSREYDPEQSIFAQGDAADAVYYLQTGKVRLTVVSASGKDAVIGTFGRGMFFGEGCLAGQPFRMATAKALQASEVVRVDKMKMVSLLEREPTFAQLFIAYILSRNVRMEADLIDQLFNSSEKRLARILLLMARFGKSTDAEVAIPTMTQETLASMVGTTRSRVSYFMNRFRKMGFIDYDGGSLKVRSGLLTVVLHE